MEARIAITNVCAASCVTCPSFLVRPKTTMPIENLRIVIDKTAKVCDRYFINNYGDFLHLPNCGEYVQEISKLKTQYGKFVSVTTNCNWPFDRREEIKPLHVDVIVASFNAHPEDYNRVLGMDYERVRANIEWLLDNFGVVEVHMLNHAYNRFTGTKLKELFPKAAVRISDKVENQGLGHERVVMKYCDYLDSINVDPDCIVRICTHDWFRFTQLGDLIEEDVNVICERIGALRQKMVDGEFPTRLCKYCNYPDQAEIHYL